MLSVTPKNIKQDRNILSLDKKKVISVLLSLFRFYYHYFNYWILPGIFFLYRTRQKCLVSLPKNIQQYRNSYFGLTIIILIIGSFPEYSFSTVRTRQKNDITVLKKKYDLYVRCQRTKNTCEMYS